MAESDQAIRWTSRLDPAAGPRYLQIVAQLEQAVATGLLRPGDRLPPQRRLAEHLAVDLTTVTRAFGEARERGLIDAVTGRGSFISARQEQEGPPLDLSMTIPPAPKGLRLGELMQRGIAEILARSDADQLMNYHGGAGSLAERAAGAAWLAPLMGTLPPQRIAVVPGAQTGLNALLSLLARPGDTILTEPLTYPGLIGAARQRGLVMAPVASDDDGPLPKALDEAALRSGARLFALTPTLQNPTCITIPEQRRQELVTVARRRDLVLIEDDPYSLLAGDAPAPMAALAPERTWHVATLSKVLTPGLRTAFVVMPEGVDGAPFLAALRSTALMPAPLMAALATHWIRIGTARDLIEAVRREAAERQSLAREILPETMQGHPYALHVWQPLPPYWERDSLIERARVAGLGVMAADAFSTDGRAPDAIRIALGAIPERARLAEALGLLARLIRDGR
ncbi:PLP-dependent aminotransferase family protein [Bosea beijingensis]|uniref:aminotransferase-like domain-containing protein n=1 Tax=Bosea beijingensis TaxID=3068632 RepID=UPI0027407F64|nr:PLP-dependent aminotransferase family protein [Bosea sp. REN20]